MGLRFSVPAEPGATDKDEIVDQHLAVFKEQVHYKQGCQICLGTT
jgi:hypothetical protein